MGAVVPRPASTVALLRDASAGVEVWMMHRHSGMAFAPLVHVFPGGAVEDADHDESLPWSGGSSAGFADVFGVDEPTARALVSAAVRETFEECGVLLAGRPGSDDAVAPDDSRRRALLDGTLAWSTLLREEGAALRADWLVPWARWITPDWSPRRFDARFFLARVPAGAEPRWIDGEADRAEWVGARDAVRAHADGDLPMLPPTIATLRALAAFGTVTDALAAAPAVVRAEAG